MFLFFLSIYSNIATKYTRFSYYYLLWNPSILNLYVFLNLKVYKNDNPNFANPDLDGLSVNSTLLHKHQSHLCQIVTS